MAIAILDMTPIGYYPDRSPKYRFSCSFPSRGVRATGPVEATPEAAFAHGVAYVKAYQADDIFGNMGEALGVTAVAGGYVAVINTYHSNT